MVVEKKRIDTCYAFIIQGPFVNYVPECGMVEGEAQKVDLVNLNTDKITLKISSKALSIIIY